jgi:hypothetical protein
VSALDLLTLGEKTTTIRYLGRVTTTSTASERREALIELASLVNDEDVRNGCKPFTPVLDLLAPVLASQLCKNPVEVFNQLVAATEERRLFVADPAEYATRNGRGTSDEALVYLDEALRADIDYWADRLMGRQS